MIVNHGGFRCVGWFDLSPTSRKIFRGLLFMIGAGTISLVAIVEGGNLNAAIAVAYLVGSLLVYGIDIERIEFGSLKVKFETDEGPSEEEQAKIDTEWHKED